MGLHIQSVPHGSRYAHQDAHRLLDALGVFLSSCISLGFPSLTADLRRFIENIRRPNIVGVAVCTRTSGKLECLPLRHVM